MFPDDDIWKHHFGDQLMPAVGSIGVKGLHHYVVNSRLL